MSLCKWRIERAVVAKFLIAHINNKATGMLNKSDLIEASFLKISGETRWMRLNQVDEIKPGG